MTSPPSSFADTLVVALGAALAGPLYAAWRRHSGLKDEASGTLSEIIARDIQSAIVRQRVSREITAVSEALAESIVLIFNVDGQALTGDQKSALAAALASTFERGGTQPEPITRDKIEWLELAKFYGALPLEEQTQLTPVEVDFRDACIREICARLLELSGKLPSLTSGFQNKIAASQGQLSHQGEIILHDIIAFANKSRKRKSGVLLDDFAFTYRRETRRTLSKVYVFGLSENDFSHNLNLDISYISIRAGRNVYEQQAAERVADLDYGDFKAETIFMHARYALLLGHAGSGKTTLLQWLSTKIVERTIGGGSSFLNSFTPFFIRLRDFYGRKLPTGNELLTCVSPALVNQAPEHWVDSVLRSGRAVFLVDGVDEVAEAQKRELSVWLLDLMTRSTGSYFLVTSRPSAVSADDLPEVFREFYLRRMSPDEIKSFVVFWHQALANNAIMHATKIDVERRVEEVETVLQANRSLARLAATPLLCAVICTLNMKGRLTQTSSRIDLYKTALRLLIHERDSLKRVIDPVYDAFSYDDKEHLLGELAYHLVLIGNTSFSYAELVNFLSKSMPSEIVMKIEVALESAVGGRFHSSKSDIFGAIAKCLIVRSSVLQDISPDTVQFVHKTFQEYLASTSVRWHGHEFNLVKNLDIHSWGEMILLTAVGTSREKASKMLSLLVDRGDRAGYTERAHYYLLAGSCASEAYGLDEEVKDRIVSKLRDLIPPRSPSTASLLAGAGELVLPLLP